MDWKNEAVNDLKNYNLRKRAIESLRDRIRLLEEQIKAVASPKVGERVMGGAKKPDEGWLNNITERERLSQSLYIAESMVELTERGLSTLEERERRVLEGFYVTPETDHVFKLCTELFLEKSTLYRLKNEALRKFTLAQYGTVEI